jgi:hypothetical protein
LVDLGERPAKFRPSRGAALPRSEPLRLDDLVRELDSLVREALRDGHDSLAAAGRRVQAVLRVLRSEFAPDIGQAPPVA